MSNPSLLDEVTRSTAPPNKLNTVSWFDADHVAKDQSPIDEFIENLYEINRLYLGAEQKGDYAPILGSLAYLGMVSAFEGYMRSLLRRLVLTDDVCRNLASRRTVTYGAAISHGNDLLPEALLENISFASTANVAYEFKTLCSVSQMGKDGQVPPQLKQLFEAFGSICHVRHCGVHRFGKLGSNQALLLGIDTHADVLEKPLALTVPHLQDIALALEGLVRGVNSFCFSDIIKRTHTEGPANNSDKQRYSWAWQRDFESDRGRFEQYYAIFASQRKPHTSPSVEDMYAAFLVFMREADGKARRRAGSSGGAVAATSVSAASPEDSN